MRLGIPRGYFYYEYLEFIRMIFEGTDIELVEGYENNESIYAAGSEFCADEVCFPIKLFTGQIIFLLNRCDRVLVPRIMKDCRGRLLCPKPPGLSELVCQTDYGGKLLFTRPVYFNSRRKTKKSLWELCNKLGVSKIRFNENFERAYRRQLNISKGLRCMHTEAAWEFVPLTPAEDEIILPNVRKVFLAGHSYNVYDKFVNMDMMHKLDELGIETVTDKNVTQWLREYEIEKLGFSQVPFWEAFVRIVGSALVLKDEVDGIIYLSSSSCRLDAYITEKLKTYVDDIPVMVLKLDEHRDEEDFDTKIEAFADFLKERSVS